MPPDQILKVTSLDAAAVGTNRLAVGMNFGQLTGIIVQAGDQSAPHFLAADEPNRDGIPFTAVGGNTWYRPDLQVSDRPSSAGPSVWFLKDADGVVRLEFDLEETAPAGLPAGAMPFSVTIDSLTLDWSDADGQHKRAFANPTIGPSADLSKQPHFLVHAGDKLARDEVQALYHAMSRPDANTHLTIAMSYGYWIDSTTSPGPVPDPWPGPIPVWQWKQWRQIKTLSLAAPTSAFSKPAVAASPDPAPMAIMPGVVAQPPRAVLIDRQKISELMEENRLRKNRHDYQRTSYSRTVPFSFDEALEANASIYRAIKGEQLADDWTSTPNGWLRRAEYPNTIYRLPDELRLAFNPDLGVPHVLPTLYRDEQGDAKVRVVMRILPWHNPRALVAIGDDLGTAPDVIVGGYESATLTFTGAFPDQIHALSGTTVPITLETGAEITLELTVEFYTFLCQLLTGPIGVTGTVSVTLSNTTPTGATTPQPNIRQVPVRLSLGAPATLALDVSVPPDAVSPGQVSLSNKSGAGTTVGGCEPRLLQYDANSVVPLEIFKAKATNAFPVSLPAGATVQVGVAPLLPDTAKLWNAVLVQLTDIKLDLNPAEVLNRIYEVAPVGTLDWQLAIDCPPLVSTPGPARFTSVIAIDVQVNRLDGSHDIVHLTRGHASTQLTMHRSLAELTAAAGDIGTFTYTVRNFYDDHQGHWGAPQQGEGSNLTVYPNDPASD
jgi:hypothetical protein